MRGGNPFWANSGRTRVRLRSQLHLCKRELRRKEAALACFRTQRGMISGFPLSPERLRRAPDYDFSVAPSPGEAARAFVIKSHAAAAAAAAAPCRSTSSAKLAIWLAPPQVG